MALRKMHACDMSRPSNAQVPPSPFHNANEEIVHEVWEEKGTTAARPLPMPLTEEALTEAYTQLTPGAEKSIRSVIEWWHTHKLSAHEVLATVQSFAGSSTALRKIFATTAPGWENAGSWSGRIAMPSAKGEVASEEQMRLLLKQLPGRTDSSANLGLVGIDACQDSPAKCSPPIDSSEGGFAHQRRRCLSLSSHPSWNRPAPLCLDADIVVKPGVSQRQLAAAPDTNYFKTLGKLIREQRAQLAVSSPDASYFKELRGHTRRFEYNTMTLDGPADLNFAIAADIERFNKRPGANQSKICDNIPSLSGAASRSVRQESSLSWRNLEHLTDDDMANDTSVPDELGRDMQFRCASSFLVDAGWSYYASGMMGPLGDVMTERIENKFLEIERRFASFETELHSKQLEPAATHWSLNARVDTDLPTMSPPISLPATLLDIQTIELSSEHLLSRDRRMHAARVDALNRLSRPKPESPLNVTQ